MSPSRVAIVVLNYRRFAETRECLASVFAGSYPNAGVILLDLGSTRDQLKSLRERHPRLRIVPLSENRGYAGNNNLGIRLALEDGADWVLLLNDDIRIAPDAVAGLTAAGEADARVGIVGPLVYHHDRPTVIQSAGGRLDPRWWPRHLDANEPDRGQLTAPRRVDWVTGCAIQIRRVVVERVGFLDERFFTYWEETEFCLRATRAGWAILNVPEARVWHKGGQGDASPQVAYYMVRNRLFFLARHRAPLTAWWSAWAEPLRTVASLTLRPGRDAAPMRAAILRGMRDFLRQRGGPSPVTRR